MDSLNNWMKNSEWRKKLKNRNVYFMRDHNYAFSAWEIERLKGTIDTYSTLVHVDSHLDDVPEAVEMKGILEEIDSPEIAIQFGKRFDYSTGQIPDRLYMRIDNFIWPAIIRNTIGNVYYVSDDPQMELNHENLREQVQNPFGDYNRNDIRDDILAKKLLDNLEKHNKRIYRYQSIEEFKFNQETFLKNERGKKLILDIDLDYFNDSNSYNSNPNLKSEPQIIENLVYLRNLANWDVITVALSPEFCGGEDACKYLYDLFLKCFEIEENELIDW